VLLTDRGEIGPIPARMLRPALDFAGGGRAAPSTPLHSSNITVDISGDAVRIAGRGHGHGAGLCQYGAEALARQGADHRAILRWYYPQVELVRAYDAMAMATA
jgi:stage II sporulation protein D